MKLSKLTSSDIHSFIKSMVDDIILKLILNVCMNGWKEEGNLLITQTWWIGGKEKINQAEVFI